MKDANGNLIEVGSVVEVKNAGFEKAVVVGFKQLGSKTAAVSEGEETGKKLMSFSHQVKVIG